MAKQKIEIDVPDGWRVAGHAQPDEHRIVVRLEKDEAEAPAQPAPLLSTTPKIKDGYRIPSKDDCGQRVDVCDNNAGWISCILSDIEDEAHNKFISASGLRWRYARIKV